MTNKEVKSALDNLARLAYKEAKNGFTISGLGKLLLAQRKARIGRNPAQRGTVTHSNLNKLSTANPHNRANPMTNNK